MGLGLSEDRGYEPLCDTNINKANTHNIKIR